MEQEPKLDLETQLLDKEKKNITTKRGKICVREQNEEETVEKNHGELAVWNLQPTDPLRCV